jgi:hypothetical protein
VSGIVTSLPIIGGITACGIFLLMISVIGLIGTIRHHQVLLFFYMVVLFLIFLIQFSVSCAALAINEDDEKKIIGSAWRKAESGPKSLVIQAEKTFDCCGLGLDKDNKLHDKPNEEDMKFSRDHKVFSVGDACYHPEEINQNTTAGPDCFTCFAKISDKVNYIIS